MKRLNLFFRTHKIYSLFAVFFIVFNLFSFSALTTNAQGLTTNIQVSPTSCNFSQAKSFRDLIVGSVNCLISPTFIIIVALSVVVFLWGVFKFIQAEGEDKQTGREFMLYGVIGIFVMISIWGLVNILQNTFTLNDNANITPKQVTLPNIGN
jgi:hypothetical protein